MRPRWREGAAPRILVVDGARTSQEVETTAMRDAEVVACVADDVVRIVKDRDGVARTLTPEEWLELVGARLKHRKNGQVIQVDAIDVRREAA
jgi:hypothetical protein